MKSNLWLYADKQEQSTTAASLIVFGAEVFKRAKMIKEMKMIKKINTKMAERTKPPCGFDVQEFGHEYLIDCIRFLIFFENYMKAELILKDYCVHVLDPNHSGFKELAKAQFKRPIKLSEIHEIENFTIDKKNKIITHPAILDKTIGIRILIGSSEYSSNYQFDSAMLNIISNFNTYRNSLHFKVSIELSISNDLVSSLDSMNDFVDKIIRERINKNAP